MLNKIMENMKDSSIGNESYSERERKAEIICRFAENISEEILRRAGFPKDHQYWIHNLFVVDDGSFDVKPFPNSSNDPDEYEVVGTMFIRDFPSDFLQNDYTEYDMFYEVQFTTNGGVYFYKDTNDPACMVMTYEEAASWIVLWLLERIIRLAREKKEYRVKYIDLYERMRRFFNEP